MKKTNLKTDCEDSSEKEKTYAQPLFQPLKRGTIFKSENQIQNFSMVNKEKKILWPTFSHRSRWNSIATLPLARVCTHWGMKGSRWTNYIILWNI